MLRQAKTPQSLPAFGMGMAVGFGAGLAMKIFWPGATAFAEAVLSKLGFEVGDIFLAMWNPEEALDPAPRVKTKRTTVKRRAVRRAAVASSTVAAAKAARPESVPARRKAAVVSPTVVPANAVLAKAPSSSRKAAAVAVTATPPGFRRPARQTRPTSLFARRRNRLAVAAGV